MQNIKRIIIWTILSQVIFLGVFAEWKKEYFVVNEAKALCGIFIPWTYEQPNWLPDNWSQDNDCKIWDGVSCCDARWFQFVSDIGDSSISNARYAAEFLASQNVIESNSLKPTQYQLQNTITRKEIMKVVANISGIDLNDSCEGVYTDVMNDWWCKYIESALRAWFIAPNKDFRPEETLTQAEALKLVFQSRNIEKRYNTASWQQDYASSAYYLWYIDEKPDSFNTPATRGWIFQAVARTYTNFK